MISRFKVENQFLTLNFELVEKMKRKIVGFDKDSENDWRAELDCGHFQHVRHKPPLVTREWILTEAGRSEKLGAELDCKKCDEGKPKDF